MCLLRNSCRPTRNRAPPGMPPQALPGTLWKAHRRWWGIPESVQHRSASVSWWWVRRCVDVDPAHRGNRGVAVAITATGGARGGDLSTLVREAARWYEYQFLVEIEQVGHLAGGATRRPWWSVERPPMTPIPRPCIGQLYWSILPQFLFAANLASCLSEQPLIRQHDWLSLCVTARLARCEVEVARRGRLRPRFRAPRRAWPTGDTCGAVRRDAGQR